MHAIRKFHSKFKVIIVTYPCSLSNREINMYTNLVILQCYDTYMCTEFKTSLVVISPLLDEGFPQFFPNAAILHFFLSICFEFLTFICPSYPWSS